METYAHQRWEHRIERPKTPYGVEDLDAIGVEGWQLVAIVGGPYYSAYYFRRPRLSHVPKWHRFSGEDLATK